MKKFFIIFICLCVGVVGSTFSTAGVVLAADFDEDDAKINLPEVYIKAVNPGYTVDGTQNVGEMIEIGRNSDDFDLLAGLELRYTNSSGNTVVLAEFSKYLWKTGETILLRLASSPMSELAHERYTKTLAFKAGPLELVREGEVVDSLCWTGKDGCEIAFDSKKPTTLVRDLETGDFRHVSNYEPEYLPDVLVIKEEPADEQMGIGDSSDEELSTNQCKGLMFSEILSYYESLQREQFIEIYNSGAENLLLDGCYVRYKNKNYPLVGIVNADGYFVRYLDDFKLTKNPTNSNTLEIVDSSGKIVDKLEYPNGQRKGAAYAMIGYDEKGEEIWKVTYAPTPGEPNNYQEFRTCEVGKVINEVTGNCVKVTSVTEKICGEGQYLNILTGRCKKIPESSGGTVCKEGYYLNTETGRCRKIQENSGADYALVPETFKEEKSFVALYLVLGVVGVGLIYIIYEFRHDIGRFFRKIKGR